MCARGARRGEPPLTRGGARRAFTKHLLPPSSPVHGKLNWAFGLLFVYCRIIPLFRYYRSVAKHWHTFAGQAAWKKTLFWLFGLTLDTLNVHWLRCIVQGAMRQAKAAA